ncbi:TolC family protein [Geobacter sp.]|uniref:TolC family protein n=1 Tax=Geobacter sp. TaxID=46610 RepID=UPI0027BAFD55|nr:TolC family protein [Geobacter sp.]
MTWRGRAFLLLAVSLAAAGCASVPREAGIGEARSLVSSREELPVRWNQGTAEDEEVSRKLDELLQSELSVEGAVQVALLANPSLQATYEELGVSQANLVQAGLLRNPVLFSTVRFPDRPPSGLSLKFEAALDFLDLLLLPARKRLAEDEFERAKLRVADRVLGMAAETRRAYYEALGTHQAASVRRLIAEAAGASLELARRIHAAGNLSDLGLAREEALHDQALVALAKSEAMLREKREHLNRLMGAWGERTALRLPAGLPDLPAGEVPLERLESIAVANRYDLAAARKELDVAARTLGITREWRWLLGAEIGATAERDTDGQWVAGPSLSLELPLFDQRQARIARDESLLRKKIAKVTALAIDIRSEVRELRDRLIHYRRLAEHYRTTVIPLRERIVGLTEREYNYMLVGAFDLITAKQQEFDAYQEYIEAVTGYWVARAELQRAVGGRLPDVSGEPDKPPPGHDHHPENSGWNNTEQQSNGEINTLSPNSA